MEKGKVTQKSKQFPIMNLSSLPQKIGKKEKQPQMVTRSAGFDHGLLVCCDPYLASHNSVAVLEDGPLANND